MSALVSVVIGATKSEVLRERKGEKGEERNRGRGQIDRQRWRLAERGGEGGGAQRR